MEQYITDSRDNGGIMAASWKHIDRIQSGNRTTQINAIRVDTNSRDEEFYRDVVIFVGIPEFCNYIGCTRFLLFLYE